MFTIAKTWKQPKCPSTEEWIKKMWYIYTMEYYSAIKNEIMPFPISLIHGILNMTQKNLFMKQKQTHRHRKQTHGYQRGNVRG